MSEVDIARCAADVQGRENEALREQVAALEAEVKRWKAAADEWARAYEEATS